jgi:hypothetical protein
MFNKVAGRLSMMEEQVAKLHTNSAVTSASIQQLTGGHPAGPHGNDACFQERAVLAVLGNMGLSKEVIAELPRYMSSVMALENHLARLEQSSFQPTAALDNWTDPGGSDPASSVSRELADLKERLTKLEQAEPSDFNPQNLSEIDCRLQDWQSGALGWVQDAVANCQSQQRDMSHSLEEHRTALEDLKHATAEVSAKLEGRSSNSKKKASDTYVQGDGADNASPIGTEPFTDGAGHIDSHELVWPH